MIWRDVVGYEGLYQVSDNGDVKRLSRKIFCVKNNSHSTLKEMIMKTKIDRYGYEVIGLIKNKKKEYPTIHRLVAKAFIDNKENKPQVNHINGIKTDNSVCNLEWCTNIENQRHSYRELGRKH